MSSYKSFLVGASFSLMLMGAAVFSQQAWADAVLLDAPSAGSSYYGMYCPSPCIAASFTLTASYHVSTIEVVLRTPTTTSFTTFNFSLQNALTDPITTFASAALTAPLGGASTEVMNVNKTLLAGTYYLVGGVPGYSGTPVTPGDVDGWLLSDGHYNNAAGTVTDGVWSRNSSTWSLISGVHSGTSYYAPAFTVHGSLVGPVCDIQLNKTSFVNGDKVIAQVARLANPGPAPVPVEVKLWFEVPGSPPVPFLTVGADGSFVLSSGFNKDFGPLDLATVQPTYPRGPYQFNCRLLHAVTGAPLAEDSNPFQLQ